MGFEWAEIFTGDSKPVASLQPRITDRDNLDPVGADPGFLLGGGTPLRYGVTDWWLKQVIKANTKTKAFRQ